MKRVIYALLVFLLVGCSDDTSTQNKAVEQNTQAKVEAKIESSKEVVSEAIEEAKERAKDLTKEVKQTAKEATQDVKEKVEEVTTAVKQEVAVLKDGSTLYAACAACHGADASKVALGKSAVIKGWSAQKIAAALNGYKDGTYGGAMKGLMAGQVKKLTSQEIEVLAKHISRF